MLNGWMADVKSGQRLTFIHKPGAGIQVNVNGAVKGRSRATISPKPSCRSGWVAIRRTRKSRPGSSAAPAARRSGDARCFAEHRCGWIRRARSAADVDRWYAGRIGADPFWRRSGRRAVPSRRSRRARPRRISSQGPTRIRRSASTSWSAGYSYTPGARRLDPTVPSRTPTSASTARRSPTRARWTFGASPANSTSWCPTGGFRAARSLPVNPTSARFTGSAIRDFMLSVNFYGAPALSLKELRGLPAGPHHRREPVRMGAVGPVRPEQARQYRHQPLGVQDRTGGLQGSRRLDTGAYSGR